MKKNVLFFILLLFLIKNSLAQFPQVKWWFDTNDAAFGQSAAGDIDKDGKLEVVFGCYRNDSCIYALNAEDGSLLWKYNTHTAFEGCNDVAPVIYDIDNDDTLDVIVPSSCNPKTFCFNGVTGAIVWQTPTRGSDSPPVIADIDNDGKPEILHGEFDGYVICINAENGSVAWEIAVDLNSWIQTAPTIVDLDGDGQLDFVVGTWNNVIYSDNKVYAYRGNNQSLLWSYPIGDVMYHGTAVADLDNDNKPELVIGSYNDTLYCINGDNGTTYWKYAYASGYYTGAPAVISDINNDGSCEVVFVSWFVVGVLSANGSLLWHYDIPGYDQAFRGAALADINNDDYLDVVFGTDGGKVIALNGNNGSLIWNIDLASHYGNTLFEFDNAPLVADFDNNDTLDIFIVGGHAEYPNFQNDFGRAYMITAGVGKGPEWLMFQNNILRNSSLCEDSASFIAETPMHNDEFEIFPNPNNGSFRLLLPESTTYRADILIIDITSRNVFSYSDIPEDRFIDIKNSSLKPGIYLLKLTENKKTFVSKLVITQ